jgi:hypothetical protein
VTEEAWLLVERELAKNTLKKDIPAFLNDAGFRTAQGKEWTYQTLLLEQRKRNLIKQQEEGKEDEGDDLSESNMRVDTDEAWKFVDSQIANAVKKKTIVSMLNLKGFLTRNGKPWTYQTLMLEQKKRKSEQQKKPKSQIRKNQLLASRSDKDRQFLECLEFAETQIQFQIIDVLNRSGKRTRKGRPWTFPTLLIELMKHGLDSEQGQQKVHVENWWNQPLSNIEDEPPLDKKDSGPDLFKMFDEDE